MYERQVIGRNVPARTEFIDLLENRFSPCHVARFCFGSAQSSQRETALAHQLNALRRGGDRLIVPAHSAQEETGAVKHRQIMWFRLYGLPRELIGFIKTSCVVRTPNQR